MKTNINNGVVFLKTSAVFLMAIVVFFSLPGCLTRYIVDKPSVTVRSNIPYHTTTITVVNNTGFMLNIIHDGRLVLQNMQPGQYFPIEMFNLSSYSTESSLAATAYTTDGRFVGTSREYRFSVDGYYRRSAIWSISRWDIQN